MTERIVVSVSQNAVARAESAILGCSECVQGATTPFWRIVDNLRDSGPFMNVGVVYILPVLASCPNCKSPIDEITLVAPMAEATAQPTPSFQHTRA